VSAPFRSPYMEWAKLHAGARHNLATSGVGSLTMAELTAIVGSPEEVLAAIELTRTDPGYGWEPLVERLAARAGVAPASVVSVTGGTSMANSLALGALLAVAKPGDEVLIERPTYELLLSTARYLAEPRGVRIRRFERRLEDRWALDPAAVSAEIGDRTRIVVVTDHHNPTGARADRRALAEIADLARRHGARLLVDEVYLQITDAPSAFHLDPETVVATASLTKAFGLSGLRCGWALAEPGLALRMRQLDDLHAASGAHPAERLSALALDHLEPIAARARRRLEENRAAARRLLDGRDDLETHRPELSLTLFPRLLSDAGDGARVEALCRLLRERHETSVVPGRYFEAPACFRVGLGEEPAAVAEALEHLGRGLDQLGAE
jgi:aspartate/methionine/tyrosine aminotransferase